ncbi:MAG: ferredoxin [Thermoprotei archaeon]|nr:MAG: ferredoxin [Thermoprotei archaeon]
MSEGNKSYRIHVVDLSTCIGCETCQEVCSFINNDKAFIKVYKVHGGIPVPLNCRHCEKAACMEVCPTLAIYRDESGAVLINPARCIGCKLCIMACPFGIPEMDPVDKVVIKCDLCSLRRSNGLSPACSAMCPSAAILYGSPEEVLKLAQSRVAERIARAKVLGELELGLKSWLL